MNFSVPQVCEAQVTSKKANLVRLETTVTADAALEQMT